MRGTRSKDNFYLWESQEEAFISTCLLSKEEEIKLWHQRLGHLKVRKTQEGGLNCVSFFFVFSY